MMYGSSMKTYVNRLAMPLKSFASLEPLTEAESRRCFHEPNPEFDALEHHLAGLHTLPPEAD